MLTKKLTDKGLVKLAKPDVYWFKHDANARRDQKILMMRSVYGAEGYGWWWMLVEMMREATGYKLKLTGKYALPMLADELGGDIKIIDEFITDCIEEFELLESDGEYFWSPSLLRRMAAYDEVVEQRRKAANARWKKEE